MGEDPRQVRTRAKLTEGLLRLLEDEPLASISVVSLCESAGVHRTTFYKHASAIEAFAVDVVTRALDEVATVAPAGRDPLVTYRQTMVEVFDHVAGERALYRPLLTSKWSGALRAAIDARMQPRVRIALDVFDTQKGLVVPENREEIVAFVSGGLVGAITLWALSDDTDAECRAARTQALMPSWWPVQ